MEYHLCRAMEICRLTEDQLFNLHEHEAKERIFEEWDQRTQTFGKSRDKATRGLMPFEIQELFKLSPLKEHYSIPENDIAQSVHNQRLRLELKGLGLAPKFDLVISDVPTIHAFDTSIREADKQGKLNLHYQGPKARNRMIEQVD